MIERTSRERGDVRLLRNGSSERWGGARRSGRANCARKPALHRWSRPRTSAPKTLQFLRSSSRSRGVLTQRLWRSTTNWPSQPPPESITNLKSPSLVNAEMLRASVKEQVVERVDTSCRYLAIGSRYRLSEDELKAIAHQALRGRIPLARHSADS